MSSLSRSHAHGRSARGYWRAATGARSAPSDVTASRRVGVQLAEDVGDTLGAGRAWRVRPPHSARDRVRVRHRGGSGQLLGGPRGRAGAAVTSSLRSPRSSAGDRSGRASRPAVGDVRGQRAAHGAQLVGGGGGDDARGDRRRPARPRRRPPRPVTSSRISSGESRIAATTVPASSAGCRGAGVSASMAAARPRRGGARPAAGPRAAIVRRICSRAFAAASSEPAAARRSTNTARSAVPSAALSSGPCPASGHLRAVAAARRRSPFVSR